MNHTTLALLILSVVTTVSVVTGHLDVAGIAASAIAAILMIETFCGPEEWL